MENLHDRALEISDRHPTAKNYKSFADIPPELLNEEYLIAWVVGGGEYSRIRNEHRTELLSRTSVLFDGRAFAHIRPDEVSDYQSLIVDAVSNALTVAREIPHEYITEELLVKIAAKRVIVLSYMDLNGKNKQLATTGLVSSVVRQGLMDAAFIHRVLGSKVRVMMTDDDLKFAIKSERHNFNCLEEIGKLRVLSDMLKEGFWPVETKLNGGFNPPCTPVEAIEQVIKAENESIGILFRHSLRLFPIEEVITSTIGLPRIADILLDVYSDRELEPHLKLSKELRGRMLESALGM
jgi:hypothetical protein